MSNVPEIEQDVLAVELRRHRSIICLRVNSTSIHAVANTVNLPVEHGSRRGDPTAHWTGEGQWLLTSDYRSTDHILEELLPNLSGQLFGISNMTSAFTCLRITGISAPTILSHGCCLDFGAESLAKWSSTRTRFARVPALITRPDEFVFEMYADSTYKDYLLDWFRVTSVDAVNNG